MLTFRNSAHNHDAAAELDNIERHLAWSYPTAVRQCAGDAADRTAHSPTCAPNLD